MKLTQNRAKGESLQRTLKYQFLKTMEQQQKQHALRLIGGVGLIAGTCLLLHAYHPDVCPVLYPHVMAISALTYLSLSRYRKIWWSILFLTTVLICWFTHAPSIVIAIMATAMLSPVLGLIVFVGEVSILARACVKHYKARQEKA